MGMGRSNEYGSTSNTEGVVKEVMPSEVGVLEQMRLRVGGEEGVVGMRCSIE